MFGDCGTRHTPYDGSRVPLIEVTLQRRGGINKIESNLCMNLITQTSLFLEECEIHALLILPSVTLGGLCDPIVCI